MADFDPLKDKSILDRSRRSASRDSLFLSATIRRNGDAEADLVPVRVRNLSAVGLMADYNDIAEPGEPVVVTVRGIGAVKGKVAWVKRSRIGIEFDARVDPKLARKPVKPAQRSATPPLRPIF